MAAEQQRPNAAGVMGLSVEQKMTAALRVLAYGLASDAVDEYVRLAESTTQLTLAEFCKTIVEELGNEYLRQPNDDDVRRILSKNSFRGFPGLLGSLDCTHWEWKNCPIAWHGQ